MLDKEDRQLGALLQKGEFHGKPLREGEGICPGEGLGL